MGNILSDKLSEIKTLELLRHIFTLTDEIKISKAKIFFFIIFFILLYNIGH